MKIRNRTMGRLTWSACLLVPAATLALVAGGEPGARLDSASAAQAFVSLLDDAGREKALFPLEDEERFNWHFVPRERNGLPLREMTTEQRAAAHDLLQAAMSSQGFLKASAVIELERILGLLEGRPERRDPEATTSRSSANPRRAGRGRGGSRDTTSRSTSRLPPASSR